MISQVQLHFWVKSTLWVKSPLPVVLGTLVGTAWDEQRSGGLFWGDASFFGSGIADGVAGGQVLVGVRPEKIPERTAQITAKTFCIFFTKM